MDVGVTIAVLQKERPGAQRGEGARPVPSPVSEGAPELGRPPRLLLA